MLGLERQRVGEVAVEIGDALTGDPVQEIERDVVESGITEKVHRSPDIVGPGPSLEDLEQVGLEALGAERDPAHPAVHEE